MFEIYLQDNNLFSIFCFSTLSGSGTDSAQQTGWFDGKEELLNFKIRGLTRDSGQKAIKMIIMFENFQVYQFIKFVKFSVIRRSIRKCSDCVNSFLEQL